MKSRRMRVKGFTLVEMMIVVAIIGLLAVIAIPNWVRARTTSQNNACISNLREIWGATQQWALDNRKGPDADVHARGRSCRTCGTRLSARRAAPPRPSAPATASLLSPTSPPAGRLNSACAA